MSTGPGGGWVLTARGRRDFRRLDTPVQRRVTDALDRLVADPPRGDITKLTGSDDEYRLRVGDWRVRFIRQNGVVYVLRVLPRPRLPRLTCAPPNARDSHHAGEVGRMIAG